MQNNYGDESNTNRCWSSSNGGAGRWWSEGETIERGNFVYQCTSGQLKPYACMGDRSGNSAGRQLQIGQSETVCDIQFTCQLSSFGEPEKQITGCVHQGQVYTEGQNWDDASTGQYFTCKRASNGYYLQVELSGCYYNGERLSFGQKRGNGKCEMECMRSSSGQASMEVCGCMSASGQMKEVGETFDNGKYTEYCTKVGQQSCEVKTVGCLHNQQRLNDGDRYFFDDTIYQCEVRPGSEDHKVMGCANTDRNGNMIERLVGCKWYNSDGQNEYEVTCQMADDNKSAYVHPEACIYMRNGRPALYIKPDTYTLYQLPEGGNLGVLCKRESKTELRIEEFPAESIATRSYGLQYEPPRGK
jgi:hypothetical protein